MNQDMSNKIITYSNASQKVSQRAGRIVPLLLLFLMLVFGDVNVWGQTTDYSGTYYIASKGYNSSQTSSNYYLCPTEGWAFFVSDETNPSTVQGNDNGKPFLTTYLCRNGIYDATKAVWTIEKDSNSNYYYIRQTKTGKYIVSNRTICNNPDRARIHLESISNPNDLNDKALFDIYLYNDHLVFKSISINEYKSDVPSGSTHSGTHDDHKWLTVNQGNKPNLDGTNAKTDGPSGFNNTGGIIGIFTEGDGNGEFHLEEIIPRPVISYNSANNQIELTHSGEDVTIYYTLDGTNPTTTNYAGTGSGITNVASSVTVKAVAVVSLEGLSYPIISPIAEIRVIPNPTLSLTSSPVVYNGSEQTPTFNVIDGETVIPESEYTITGYSNNTNAGEATVTITDSDGGNYIVYGSPTFTINPKPLTITAKPQSITYGDAPVNDGVTYGEFAAGEDENGLTGTLAYTYNYEQYGDAGEYTITPGGLSNSNYDITFVPGTLIVNKKEVGLTWGETTSFTYNGLEQAPAATATSLLNGDVIDVMVTGATNVGDHTATASGLTGTKAGNYKLPEVKTQEFTITKAPLTITASNHTITYGDVPANDGVGYSGFVNDESSSVLGGSLSYAYNYTQYGNVGEYTITPSGLTSDNYYITFTPGVLTVTPKTIGVDWTETELSYNGSEQAPTATATGLVNNDEVGVTVTGAQTNVGTDYIATASALTGEKKDNYQLPEGLTTTFTITPKSIGDGNKAADDIIIELSPEGELSVVKQGEKILVENTDYTQETEVDGDDKIITITGMGNYTGSVKALFANPVFTDPDGTGSEKAAAVYTASRDLSAPAGIEPYIVRKVNPSIGTLVISKLDYIPEDVPVLLLSNAESEGFVASPKDPSVPEVTVQTKNSNQLKVSHGGETVEAAQIYMFYKGEFVLTKAGTLGEGKYFLYNPNFKVTSSEDEEKDEPGDNPASSRGVLRIVFEDETTGIDDLKNEKTEEWKLTGWYSLDGRRLSGKPTKGGIYIHKGQKIYIKR